MLTGLLVVFPLLAALLLLFTRGKAARNFALLLSAAEFALALAAYFQFRHNPDAANLVLNCNWIPSLNVKFAVAMDGMDLLLVLLTTLLVPVIILSSFKNDYESPHSFYSLILLMQSALVGVFVAKDGFLFYVFWELALIPIYFICLRWGGENRGKITFKFFVYTLFGSLFMLLGFIFLYRYSYMATGARSWALQDLIASGRSLSESQQSFVFWCFFIAFAIKLPVFPFHTWQPDTYVTAPTQGTMLLSGIMLKMGTFGLMRWLLPVVPLGIAKWGDTAVLLSVIGIIYASCIAIVQKDYKRLIAYSSVAHVGLIAAGIFSMNQQGLQGALVQMVAHGVNVVALFLIADILLRHSGTRQISELGGIRNVDPVFAVLFLIVLLGSVALPLTNGFIGEFLLLTGLFSYSKVLAAFAGLGVILGAVYMLRSYQGIMLGESNSLTAKFAAVSGSDKAILILMVVLIIAMGVYPKPLNDLAEPAVNALMSGLK
jgi:NADH-quinone oxidoreductase subunit M